MIAGVGYLVWGHHMFTSGESDMIKMIFSALTFFVAIPTGVKFFDWIATMYKASIDFKTSNALDCWNLCYFHNWRAYGAYCSFCWC